MSTEHLFHFTPSLMSAQTLEQLLVQRQPLAQRLVDLIRESALTGSKHHSLLIGPRGMGKTHLVALAYHRIKAAPDLQDKLCIAWMREEEWGVDSFLDLLLRVCRALQLEYPEAFPADRLEALYQHPADAAERLTESLLMEFVAGRTLLLVVENVDDLFKGLGETGQHRWRAFLQETAFCTLLATSQRLFDGVSRQNKPFYGFFHTYALDEFSVEDATELLENIARFKKDAALANYLETPAGRARVRAVNHLAGGNPRVYVIFSDFLTRESLDNLVDPFLSLLDELTPYYQARLLSLSNQQRKIVEFLSDRAAPATVKEIAQRCFITSQTASGQLKDLKDKGYVQADPLGSTGRDTYYELKEPLLRFCLNVKKSRSGSLRLLIDFLRLWYPVTELRHQLDICSADTPIEHEYLSLALEAAESSLDSRVQQCNRDYQLYLDHGQHEKALHVTEELLALQPDTMVHVQRAACFIALGKAEEALSALNVSLQLDADNAAAWYLQGNAFVHLGRYQEALLSHQCAVELAPQKGRFRAGLAFSEELSNKQEEAYESWIQAVKLDPNDAFSQTHYGEALTRRGQHGEALSAFDTALSVDPSYVDAWLGKAKALWSIGRAAEALTACDQAIRHNPSSGLAWFAKGMIFNLLLRYAEAAECCKTSIGFEPRFSGPYMTRAEALFALHRFSEGFRALQEGLQRLDADVFLTDYTTTILRHLFHNVPEAVEWRIQTQGIIQLYRKYHLLEALAAALTQNIKEVISPFISRQLMAAWYEAWKTAAHDLPEFALPLRLLDTAIRYQGTQDKRVLLDLPIEERKILNALLIADGGVLSDNQHGQD